jgi:hydrogenase maturation protease
MADCSTKPSEPDDRPATAQAARPLLVIGWGNELRGDDGAGRAAAEAVGAAGWPGVEALSARQLAPEHAERCAEAGAVVFVDARAPAAGGTLRAERVAAATAPTRPGALGHAGDPRGLLALTRDVYGAAPPAWLLTLPAASFGTGAVLSPEALEGVREAVAWIAQLCNQTIGTGDPHEHGSGQRGAS